MAKKKEEPKNKTFKPMPEPPGGIEPEETKPDALEVPKDGKQALAAELLKVEGMNLEMAEHMAAHGIPADSYVVQTFYRVSAVTADAVIKVFQEVMK